MKTELIFAIISTLFCFFFARVDSAASLAVFLPTAQQLDSTRAVDTPSFYDTTAPGTGTSLYDKIDGAASLYLDRGFLLCVYQKYIYSNPLLKRDSLFALTINQMKHVDSAKSIYNAVAVYADTVEKLSYGDEALISKGSWNLSCIMRKGIYFIEFDGVRFDTTPGCSAAIHNKFKEFCQAVDDNIVSIMEFKEPSGLVAVIAYPNPFKPNVNIKFNLVRPARVKVSIYNSAGHFVRSLMDSQSKAGYMALVWNGLDFNKKAVASGNYFLRIQLDDKILHQGLVSIK